jgi:two-component sensor histidine kinase
MSISLLFVIILILVIGARNRREKLIYKDNADLIIKEMNHRIKNNIGILTNIIDLKKYIYTDDDSQKLLNDLRNKTFLISHIHEKIYTSVDITEIELSEYVEEIIDTTNNFYDAKVNITYVIDSFKIAPKHAINFALLIQEVFTNSVKHAYDNVEDKKFSIYIKEEEEFYNLTISDNGCGFDPVKLDISESFGMEMLKTIVEQYSGEMKFTNNNGMHVNIKFTKQR